MTADKLKTLLCAIETGTLSGAAEKLGYTPSGVSRLIVSLEEELGFRLLVRNKNGVAATRECEILLPAVRNIIHHTEQCEQLAAAIRGTMIGSLTVGTSYSFYYKWLGRLMAEFKKDHPGVNTRLVYKNSTLLTEALEKREIDLAIISRREGNMNWIPLKSDPMMAWLPKDHPLAGAKSFPLERFREEPYVEPYPDEDTDNARVFRANGISPNVCYSVNDTYAVYSLVDAGLGVGLMNGLIMENWSGNVAAVPVSPAQNIEIGIITPQKEDISPVAGSFISYLKERI